MPNDLSLMAEEYRVLDEIDRRDAQDSFLAFYRRMTGFRPPRHVRLVCKLLQRMEEDWESKEHGRLDRVMIFMPPRHAKTTVCTHLFSAWLIGRNPKTSLMVIAHTHDYAKTLGGDIRKYVYVPEWPWPDVALSGDSQAKDRWRTNHGGQVNTFGAGAGNMHGRPAEWLIMDDIIKGWEMADSPHQRDVIWNNYLTDLRSRLQGRRKQIMIYTRWSEDDPAGRILPENFDGRSGWYNNRKTGEPWYVLSLPAVAEHDNDPLGRKAGEWLWPEERGEEALKFERAEGGRQWSALFQQRPAPEEGLMFKAEWLQNRYSRRNVDMTQIETYISSDYAVSEDDSGSRDPDFTVHMVWGVDPDFRIYLLDMWRGRENTDRWVDEWIALCRRHNPLRAVEEQGQIVKAVGPFLVQRMRKEGVFVDRQQLTSTTKKTQRAASLIGMMASDMVYLPQRHECHFLEHLDAFEKELLQFPAGRHDDTVDAATLFGRFVHRIVEGRRQPKPKRHNEHGPSLDDLFDIHEQETKDDW